MSTRYLTKRLHLDFDGVPLQAILERLLRVRDRIVVAHVFETRRGFHVRAIARSPEDWWRVLRVFLPIADKKALMPVIGVMPNMVLRFSPSAHDDAPRYLFSVDERGVFTSERARRIAEENAKFLGQFRGGRTDWARQG